MKALLISAALLAVSTIAQAAPSLTSQQEADLNSIQAILMENPELIGPVNQSLLAHTQQQSSQAQLLSASHDYIYNNPRHVQWGAENPELTIVVFHDFSCPFCKRLHPVLEQATKAHSNLKVISLFVPLKEMSSDRESINSATYALNVWQQEPDAFHSVNEALMKKWGAHNTRSVEKVAKSTGTETMLETNPAVNQMMQRNYELFVGLGVRGTPGMFIGDEFVSGYIDFNQLDRIIKQQLRG